jgi:NAD(P)H-hydrate repair Nnr-like enzyme with NAD(P)H-hydrate dehydratase domain
MCWRASSARIWRKACLVSGGAAAGVWLHAHCGGVCGGVCGAGLTADRLVEQMKPLVAFRRDVRA